MKPILLAKIALGGCLFFAVAIGGLVIREMLPVETKPTTSYKTRIFYRWATLDGADDYTLEVKCVESTTYYHATANLSTDIPIGFTEKVASPTQCTTPFVSTEVDVLTSPRIGCQQKEQYVWVCREPMGKLLRESRENANRRARERAGGQAK